MSFESLCQLSLLTITLDNAAAPQPAAVLVGKDLHMPRQPTSAAASTRKSRVQL
jgi:hypothetical protein